MIEIRLIIYTPLQKDVLTAMRRHFEAFGYWGGISQLEDFMGKTRGSLNAMMRSLVEKGGVQKKGHNHWKVIDPRYNPSGVLERMGKVTLEELSGGATQLLEVDDDFPHLDLKKNDLILVAPVYDRRWVHVKNTKSWLTGKVVGYVRRVRNGDSHGNDLGD